MKHRVVLIEDETVFRQLLTLALGKMPNLLMLGDFQDGQEGLAFCLREQPDLAIVDLYLPGMHGLDVARQIRSQLPNTQVLILTGHPDPALPAQLMSLGVHGFVSKTEPLQSVLQAVDKVLAGGMFFTAGTPARPPLNPVAKRPLPPLPVPLTARELEVARKVAEGLSSKEIAAKLDLSVRTVEKHRANIMDKIGVRETASMVRWCVQNGLV